MQNDKVGAWEQALSILRATLEALDIAAVPDTVCAHVDLAVCRLEDAITSCVTDQTFGVTDLKILQSEIVLAPRNTLE